MEKTKILILSTSDKIEVAENIYEELEISENYMPRLEVFRYLIVDRLYNLVSKYAPGLWGFMYFSKVIIFLTLSLRRFFARLNYKNILGLVMEFDPSIAISTDTASSAIVAYLKSKGLYKGKLVISFSDYHLHKFWLYKEADLYLCITKEQADGLKNWEIPQERIVITGMIISDRFLVEIDKEKARRKYNLLNTMPVVLLISSGLRSSWLRDVFLSLLRSIKAYQVVVITGRDTKSKEELESISAPSPHPIKILGIAQDMEALMSASDVLVGEINSLTIAEAVAKKLPIIITDARAGSAVANMEYLLKYKIVEYGRIAREVVFMVEQSLGHRIKQDLEQATEKIIRPKNYQSLLNALDRVNDGQASLQVKNYQEN